MGMKKGDLIGGKYEVMEKLGKGGAGSVYRVYDVRLHKFWAAKRVKAGAPGMEEKVLGKVDGKLFPRIVDVVEEEDCRYLVMDWIEGETLAQKLEKRGEFSERETAEMGIALCDALRALHEMQPSLLYLDCKPSNVMVDGDGKLWLIDFGSAVECGEADAVPIAASPGYAAPEQLAGRGGARRVDVRSDVFGLGRTLYALLGGPDPSRPPYGACRIGSCNAGVPKGLEKIVERCTAADPNLRFQTVQAVKEALLCFLEEDRASRHFKALRKAGTWVLLLFTAWRGWIFYSLVPQVQEGEALRAFLWVVAAACMAACWQRFAVEKRGTGRPVCEPVYSILRTEKKAGRWMAGLLIGTLAALTFPVGAQAEEAQAEEAQAEEAQAKEAQKISPVVLRDEQLRKLLVREDSVLRSETPIYMEINPALFETQEELEITVRARGRDSGREYEYVLRYWPETGAP